MFACLRVFPPLPPPSLAQGIAQAYKVVGSFEVLGNPIDAVSRLGEGVKDFFYAPAEGLMQSPLAFGKGLIRGSSSLLRNSVAGLFGAFSAMTGSLGRGFALLSGDESDNQSCVSFCFAWHCLSFFFSFCLTFLLNYFKNASFFLP